jgi:hypothetical protein
MPRQSQQEELTTALHVYLVTAEKHTSEEYSLDVRSVAKALGVSPTTVYKYRLDEEIHAAEQRQREHAKISGKTLDKQNSTVVIRDLRTVLEQERERNKNLVARLAIMEANAARLGFDPEEMYRPLLKPVRTVSHAGKNNKLGIRR